ncbi:MAG: amidohydrolase family protein [Bifidobacteriaceae bacterium]|jgi:adenine deaminase|nr:amidohydrolase family protein [Bifidobacteriaceae bacterium]
MPSKQLLDVAAGLAPADLVIVGGQLVNVYSGEIYEGGVAVSGDRIAAVGDVSYAIGEGTEVIDAAGLYITPGFIDAHIHPESSSFSIRQFAEIVLLHGTTSIVTDIHEVGVVAGQTGIAAVLEENATTGLNIYYVVPSHIPFSPNLETSGAIFNAEIIADALNHPQARGLSETVGEYIWRRTPDLLAAIDETLRHGYVVHGHLPHASTQAFNLAVAAGVTTDHEAISADDVLQRLRGGTYALLRDGSAARSLRDLLPVVLESGLDTARVAIITDDINTTDLVDRGHLDEAVRTALSLGASFIQAVQFVTINPANASGVGHEVGGLAPGRRADINLTTGPEDFKVVGTFAAGKRVAWQGQLAERYPVAEHHPALLKTVSLVEPVTAESIKFRVDPAARQARILVADVLPWIAITTGREAVLDVVDGVVQADLEKDVLYIVQVERHGKNGNIGRAFQGGFHLTRGAIGSSVGHDNHNIIVIGTNHEDIATAVNRIVELDGGQVVVDGGEILAESPFPVLGLLSDLPFEDLVVEKYRLNDAAKRIGSSIPDPFIFLSFISLAAIPEYAVTDHGFIDVARQEVIDPVLEVIK